MHPAKRDYRRNSPGRYNGRESYNRDRRSYGSRTGGSDGRSRYGKEGSDVVGGRYAGKRIERVTAVAKSDTLGPSVGSRRTPGDPEEIVSYSEESRECDNSSLNVNSVSINADEKFVVA